MTISVAEASVSQARFVAEPNWASWVSASRTRNWCKNNTLQDWFERWGDAAGFERDPERDPATDFQRFIFAKGHEFERGVLRCLHEMVDVETIDWCEWTTKCEEAVELTRQAMVRGVPVIHQGVLWNLDYQTHGAADLLIRSDVLRNLFPEAIGESEIRIGAPALMVQTFIYNEALGLTQGYLPPGGYLLGRSWSGPQDSFGTSCYDRLGPIPHDLVRRGPLYAPWLRLRFPGSDA